MPKAICVKCQVYLVIESNDIRAVETFQKDFRKPYAVYHADLWRCPSCGFEIVLGFGGSPEFEHFHDNFKARFECITERIIYAHEY